MQRFALSIVAVLALVAPPPALSQSSDRLSGPEAAEVMDRISDLLEATRIVIPELSRAGAPLQENFRQGVNTLRTTPSRDHTGVLYQMLTNAKAYLQLSDTLPKSAEFSDDIARQLSQLREGIQRLEAHFRATLALREEQVLGSDRDNLRRYAEANRMVGSVETSDPRVIFLGDSITDGWRLNQYFAGKQYLNRGIGGQITGQMLGRHKPDVIDLQPSVMVLLAGTNDLARGVPDATIRHNLQAIGMLAEAARNRSRNGLHPASERLPQGREPALSAHALPRPDAHRAAEPLAGGALRVQGLGLSQLPRRHGRRGGPAAPRSRDDGLHPNTEGYKVMAPLAEQAVQAALSSMGPRRRRR